jgi:hypothetical protein
MPFDLLLHVPEKTLLAAADMLHRHLFRAAPAGLLLNSLFDALPHKQGDAGDGLLCLVSPIHDLAPPDRIDRILH